VNDFDPNLDFIPHEVHMLGRLLPRFAGGRIDYTNAASAPVLDCYVVREDRLLILKRKRPIGPESMPWHVVSGFIDRQRTLREHVYQELLEEIRLRREILRSLRALTPYEYSDRKLWTVYPVIAEADRDWNIQLDPEHTGFKWIARAEIPAFLLPHVCEAFALATPQQ